MKLIHRGPILDYPVPHDPDSTVWYAIVFDDAIGGATIQTGSFSLSYPGDEEDEGLLTIEDSEIDVEGTFDGQAYEHVCRVLLSGGILGEKYIVSCTIATSSGEVIQKSFRLRIGQN